MRFIEMFGAVASCLADGILGFADRAADFIDAVRDFSIDPDEPPSGSRRTRVVVTVRGSDDGFLAFSPYAGDCSCVRYSDRAEFIFEPRLPCRTSSAAAVGIYGEARWLLSLECGSTLRATMRRLDRLAQRNQVIEVPVWLGQHAKFSAPWGATVSVQCE